jgi:hypothetical protein
MAMPEERDERLAAELSLLEAMYPDHVTYNPKAREVKYSVDRGSFRLRLPAGYLINELPEVISANLGREDGREILRETVANSGIGDEVLDSIVSSFNQILESNQAAEMFSSQTNNGTKSTAEVEGVMAKATIVVWLHHLLNTNKRKQALSPPSPEISGITKPGYPGVLVYSGAANNVHEHVNELRQLNWQAFSVRLESDEEWIFQHGKGVKEFESMKEVVADILDDKKEMFMESMRMK